MAPRRKATRVSPVDASAPTASPEEEAAFRSMEGMLVVMPASAEVYPRYDVFDAVTVVRRLSAATHTYREKFEILEPARPGLLMAVESMSHAASALAFVEHQIRALERLAELPKGLRTAIEAHRAEIANRFERLYDRRAKLVLDEVPPARVSLGFLGWYDDLDLLGELCEQRAQVLLDDEPRWLALRDECWELTSALRKAVGDLLVRDASEWSRHRARINGLVMTAYAWVRHAIIYCDDERDTEHRFPPLVVAANALTTWRLSAPTDAKSPTSH